MPAPVRPEREPSLIRTFDRANEQERLFGLRLDGVWMHVGIPDAIAAAEEADLESVVWSPPTLAASCAHDRGRGETESASAALLQQVAHLRQFEVGAGWPCRFAARPGRCKTEVVRKMAKQVGSFGKAKSAAAVVSAFIDPPGASAPLLEWIEYRTSLDSIDHPGIERFKRKADREIVRKQRVEQATAPGDIWCLPTAIGRPRHWAQR